MRSVTWGDCEIHICDTKFSKLCYRKNLRSRELFSKWCHDQLDKGNAHGTSNGCDHIAVAGQHENYRKTSNIRRALVGNKIVDHSDVVGASPVGAAPTTSSFST